MVCGEGSELADGMNGADWVLVFRALKDAGSVHTNVCTRMMGCEHSCLTLKG